MPGLKLDVRGDIRQVERWLSTRQKKVIAPAAARAINRALTPSRNEAAKTIQQQVGVRRITVIKRSLTLSKARVASLHGEIIANARYKLNVVETMPSGRVRVGHQKGGGITYREYGRSVQVKYGFIIPGKYSNKLVAVVRTNRGGGSGRKTRSIYASHYLPIEFVKPAIIAATERVAAAVFKKNFEHEIGRRLSQL